MNLDASAECVGRPPGRRSVRLRHRGAEHPWCSPGGVRPSTETPRPTLLGDGGVPRTGWWALARSESDRQAGRARLHAQPPPRPVAHRQELLSSRRAKSSARLSRVNKKSTVGALQKSRWVVRGRWGVSVRSGMYPLDVTLFSQMEAWSATRTQSRRASASSLRSSGCNSRNRGASKPEGPAPGEADVLSVYEFLHRCRQRHQVGRRITEYSDLTAQVLFRTSFIGNPDYAQNVPGEGEAPSRSTRTADYTGQVTIYTGHAISRPSALRFALYGAIASVRSGHNTVACSTPRPIRRDHIGRGIAVPQHPVGKTVTPAQPRAANLHRLVEL